MSFSFRDNKAPLNVGAQLKILICFGKCRMPSALWPFTVSVSSKTVINCQAVLPVVNNLVFGIF